VNSSNGDNKDYFDHSYIRNPNNELRSRNTVSYQQPYNIDNSRIGLNSDNSNIQSLHQNFHPPVQTHRTTRRHERVGQELDPNFEYVTPYHVERWNLDKDNNPHAYQTGINTRERELNNNYRQRVTQNNKGFYTFADRSGDEDDIHDSNDELLPTSDPSPQDDLPILAQGYLDNDGIYVLGQLRNKNDNIVTYVEPSPERTPEESPQQKSKQRPPSINKYVQPSTQGCVAGSFPDCAGQCVAPGKQAANVHDCFGNCYNVATGAPKGYVDCMGNCILNGKPGATLDCKGVCTPVGQNPTYELDCGGVCYNVYTDQPTYLPDCSGKCSKGGAGAIPGCNGVCGSDYAIDCAGQCVAPGKGASLDCNGDCNGRATIDCAGACTKFGDQPKHLLDCNGQCYLASGPPPHVRDCSNKCVLQGQETSYYDICGCCIPKGQGKCNCNKRKEKESRHESSSSESREEEHKKHHHHKAHEFRQEVSNHKKIITKKPVRFANKNDQ